VRSGSSVRGDVAEELERVLDSRRRYAVRSSADVEDGAEHSFAGQFKTVLNVMVSTRSPARSKRMGKRPIPAVRSYWRRQQGQDSVRMAVIIQDMVVPVLSVSLSAAIR